MEKESFEDYDVAELLNKNYIAIKVDREERPDIDAVYMNVTQMMTGSGGWPMSVFIDFDKNPIFAGTYFPKNDGRYGTGFTTILEQIAHIWKNNRVELFEKTINIMEQIQKVQIPKDINYKETIEKCFNQLKKQYDFKYGGFGTSPKFPSPHNLLFLLRYYQCTKNTDALAMAEKTLQCMYKGGIYDHIGFGFCRYSTDRKWLVPHFEKMLYDNALLAIAYCEAFQCTKKSLYKNVADEIFTYLTRDMMSENGAFFSAEDADSEGVEGKFYVFTKEEIIKILGSDDSRKFCAEYNVTNEGNFENSNILNLISDNQFENLNTDNFFIDCKRKLFAYREKRIHPLRDDKILTSWNGLMITAFAHGGRVLNNDNYIKIAEKAVKFIFENMTDENGNLYARYREGEAKFDAIADDYAFLIWGLIELYESTLNEIYLAKAYKYNAILIENFWENGALYLNSKKSEQLIIRPREIFDGAIPSANSVSINNFIKLSRLCGDNNLENMAIEIIRFFGSSISNIPYGYTFTLCGIINLEMFSCEIVFSGEKNNTFTEMLNVVNSIYSPFTVVSYANKEISEHFEFYKNYISKNKKTSAYLCENKKCGMPLHTAEELEEKMKN